ncbi:MAG TPA: adenylate/guanylate cyclase domain-containing protein [Thermoleophilaceae bacterium]
MTVLFADVVGSMELAERTDPEDWQAIMERLMAILCAGVHRFEGTVDKFTGDGMMALFGAPIAHEDHARRACYAALHLQGELEDFETELRRTQGLGLSVRMGMNSGEVAVGAIGEDLGMEFTAVGHTVGLAERMEQLAAPDRVYLSEHTASLAEGYLALRDLGEFHIKGASRPLRVHELTGVGSARGRLDVARARGLSRFVGRADELQVLESAWVQAQDGGGQLIGVVGEAGVGKSRLCDEFVERQRAKEVPVYHVAGQAHAKSLPLMPLLQFLRSYFEVTDRDSDQAARERIAGKLLLLDQAFAEDLPLLFDFLAVPDPERPPERMDPDARQRALLGLFKRLTRAQGAREPSIMVVEDLHWLDAASELFLANHVEASQGTRGLTIVNFRPEYRAAWMSHSYYRQIALAPLGPEAIDALLADLLGSDPSLDGLFDLVRERTGGNPFFVEEVVQSLVEAGSLAGERGAFRLVSPVAETAVPASVQAVLAARIDRLGPRAKAVLQAASVIGREFSVPVLAQVAECEPEELENVLGTLVAAEFVYEQELYPETLYAFKHPLTREVAYGSQLGERRAGVHAAVARAIIEWHSERLDERAALVAQHWQAAGEELEAARWHARAARWAGFNDPTHALEHWRQVRELADELPESAESMALGLAARVNALNYGWRLGMSTEQAEAAFSEAEAMAARAGDVRSRALLLSAYGSIRGTSAGDVRGYAELVRQAIALAEESGDPELYVAVGLGAYSLYCIGEYREALAIYDRAIELADGDPTVAAGISVGCPYAFCFDLKGLVLTDMGELDEARRMLDQARKIAGEQGDSETVAWSHMKSCWLGYFLGDSEAALGHAQQALEISERIGEPFSRAWSWTFLGLAKWMRGEWQAAVEAYERARAISTERRTAIEGEAVRLAFLAECHFRLGDLERARALVAEAIASADERGRPADQITGRLVLARILLGSSGRGAREQIEAALSRALELADVTGAKAFVPLVHVELAELARECGDADRRARELREAHHVFTEIGASGQAERLAAELAQPAS